MGGSGPHRPASEQLSRKAGSILGSRDEHGQRYHFPIPASTTKLEEEMADPGSASSLVENPSAVNRNHEWQQWREEVMKGSLALSWLLG